MRAGLPSRSRCRWLPDEPSVVLAAVAAGAAAPTAVRVLGLALLALGLELGLLLRVVVVALAQLAAVAVVGVAGTRVAVLPGGLGRRGMRHGSRSRRLRNRRGGGRCLG